MLLDTIEEAKNEARKNNYKEIIELVCPKCGKSFFFVSNKRGKILLYGFWMHTSCEYCGYKKYGGFGDSFKTIKHKV